MRQCISRSQAEHGELRRGHACRQALPEQLLQRPQHLAQLRVLPPGLCQDGVHQPAQGSRRHAALQVLPRAFRRSVSCSAVHDAGRCTRARNKLQILNNPTQGTHTHPVLSSASSVTGRPAAWPSRPATARCPCMFLNPAVPVAPPPPLPGPPPPAAVAPAPPPFDPGPDAPAASSISTSPSASFDAELGPAPPLAVATVAVVAAVVAAVAAASPSLPCPDALAAAPGALPAPEASCAAPFRGLRA